MSRDSSFLSHEPALITLTPLTVDMKRLGRNSINITALDSRTILFSSVKNGRNGIYNIAPS